jgi:hypothetical protein
LTLPISARRLWLTHLLAVLIATAATLLVAAAFVALKISLFLYVLHGRNPLDPDVPRLFLHLFAGLVLAAVILQSRKPTLHQIPSGKGTFLFTVVVLTGILGLLIVLGSLPLPFILLPLGAAACVGWVTFRSLPATLTLVPLEADAAAHESECEDTARPSRGFAFAWLLQRSILRCLYGSRLQYGWLAAPFLLGLGILLGGVTWTGNSGLYYIRFTLFPITLYLMLAFFGQPLRNLYRLDPLPISRRWFFAATFLPGLVVLSLGYGVAKVWEGLSPPRELISYRMDPDSNFYLYVPVRADSIAWDGQPPRSTSPWGESHEAWSEPLCRGCRAVIYSPFHTPPGSSLDFVALQISRASEALYVEAVQPEAVKDRYLTLDDEGLVALKGEALTLQADFPALRPRGNGPLFPIVLALVGFSWALLAVVFLRSFRATVSDGKRKAFFFGLLTCLLAIHIGQFAFIVSGITRDWIVTGTMEILVRQAGGAGALLVWIACVLILSGAFRLAESAFHRIEVPPMPGRLHPLENWFSN